MHMDFSTQLDSQLQHILQSIQKLTKLISLSEQRDVLMGAYDEYVLSVQSLLSSAETLHKKLTQTEQRLFIVRSSKELKQLVQSVFTDLSHYQKTEETSFDKLRQNLQESQDKSKSLCQLLKQFSNERERKPESLYLQTPKSFQFNSSPTKSSSPPGQYSSNSLPSSARNSVTSIQPAASRNSFSHFSPRQQQQRPTIRQQIRNHIRDGPPAQSPPSIHLPQQQNHSAPSILPSSSSLPNSPVVGQKSGRFSFQPPSLKKQLQQNQFSNSWPRIKSPYPVDETPQSPVMEKSPLAEHFEAEMEVSQASLQLLEVLKMNLAHVEDYKNYLKSSQSLPAGFHQDLFHLETLYEKLLSSFSQASDPFLDLTNQLKTADDKVKQLESQVEQQKKEIHDLKVKMENEKSFAMENLQELLTENSLLKQQRKQSVDLPYTENIVNLNLDLPEPIYDFQSNMETASSSAMQSLFSSPAIEEEEEEVGNEMVDYSDIFDLNADDQHLLETSDRESRMVESLLNGIEKRQQKKQRDFDFSLLESLKSLSLTSYKSFHQPLSQLKSTEVEDQAAIKIQALYKRYRQRKQFKRLRMRKHIATELVDTEISYLKGLLTVYKLYYLPLQKGMILPKEKVQTLFGNVKEIMTFHCLLLNKLEKRIHNWHIESTFGDLFVDYGSKFQMYTHYVNNYNKALGVYHESVQSSNAFNKFLLNVKTQQGKRSLDLLDLFITPIQRIPRYVLLLKEILRNTLEQHPDYQMIQKAMLKLQKVAEIINEQKRQSEQFNHLIEIQTKILQCPFELAVPNRKLLLSGEIGELTELGKRKQREIFLFNDLLVCTQVQKSRFTVTSIQDKSQLDYKWSVHLKDIQVGLIERIQERFQSEKIFEDDLMVFAIGILGKERKILLTYSLEDRDKWMQALYQAKSALPFEQSS